ncbi:MAG: hypothetical protein J6A67_02505, partial [Clostridia bacterium]|nr:hypothetical protein [Clostridia bacterium]
MAKSKRILSAILSIAMVLSLIPMGIVGASAADADVVFDTAAVDTGDGKLVVPTVTLTSTKVIRVAENADGATFKNGTTIVPATPSGLPKINSGYTAQYYCDETPASPQVVFTTDTALAATPTISCENNANVTFSEASQSGNTYTWTITGGTGVTVGDLKFVVDYSNSYVDSLTGKTITNYFKAYTTSHVDTIAQPGAFSAFRSRTGSVGHENVRCSYIVRILGASTYGGFAAYNDEDDAESAHGYYDFIANTWVDLGTTNQANGYGTMIYEVSNDSGDGSRMINANVDHWRPTSTTYVDRGLSTSLGYLNLRLTQFERQGDRKDGYTYYARYSRMKLLEGSVYAHTDAIENNSARLELGLSQDLTSDFQIANFGYTNVPLNGSTYGNSATLDEATGNYVTEYTLVYSGGSHYSKVDRVANADVTMGIRIESYDKSELRGYIDELLVDHDPTTKLAATSEIGIYPQAKFYSAGWDAYKTALQNAQGILNKPNTNQNEINASLSTLETAVGGLVVAEADYSVVDIAVAEAGKLNALNYTESSWANLQATLDAADAAQGYSVFYQSAVDKLAMDINDAIEALEFAEADWSLVDEAIAVYEQLDPSLYTPESWTNLRNAVNTAMEEKEKDPPYTVQDQEYVNSLAKQVSDAIDALEDALADYSKFDEQVARYNNEVLPQKAAIEAELAAAGINIADYGYTTIYDSVKWRRLQAALNFERGLTYPYQPDVNDATETLKSAIDNLTLADAYYEDVNYWIEEADAIDASWYTAESYQKVLDAVDAVVEGKKIDEQVTVNGYATAIEAAIKGLEYEYADYGEVEKAIEEAEKIDPSIYTDDSYNAIWTIVDNIDWNLYAKDQDVVDGYVTAINNAIDNLEELPADYSAVEDAKDRWATYTDTSIYTNASVAAVVNAINAVDYSKTITQQAEVDAMAAAINTAIDNLQEKGADYAALKDAFAAAKAELKKHNDFKAANGVGYYTDATIADLQAAIDAVPVNASGTIIEDKKLSEQADVDALTAALVEADEALKVNPADYSELNAILRTVPSEEDLERLYTVDSAAAVLAAVINANAVDPDLTVEDQATIDALVAEVDNAIKGLKYKTADYTAVEEAIAAANTELAKGIWTADSAKAVEDAIAAVEEGYDINRQAEVDAMAALIVEKTGLLEEAYADYTKVNEAKDAAAEINTAIVTPESYAKVTDAIAAVVEGLYAKDQATVDGYAKAINDAIAALEYVYADWSKVDALIKEIEGLDPSLYSNYDEIYYTYLYQYMYSDIPAAKKLYVYVDTQAQVDAVYEQLNTYYQMLELAEVYTERFDVKGTASIITQGGVNYIVGLQTSLTKAKFQSTYADYENVKLEYEMT